MYMTNYDTVVPLDDSLTPELQVHILCCLFGKYLAYLASGCSKILHCRYTHTIVVVNGQPCDAYRQRFFLSNCKYAGVNLY